MAKKLTMNGQFCKLDFDFLPTKSPFLLVCHFLTSFAVFVSIAYQEEKEKSSCHDGQLLKTVRQIEIWRIKKYPCYI